MMVHKLKVLIKYFDDIASGVKPFEVRVDDRPYQVGDELYLNEYCDKTNSYTGAFTRKTVTYILGRSEDEKRFVPEGYVILGLKP